MESIQEPPQLYGENDAVELRRFDDPFDFFEGQRVFIAARDRGPDILKVSWSDAGHHLLVTLRPFDSKLIQIQEHEYKGITITYEVKNDQ